MKRLLLYLMIMALLSVPVAVLGQEEQTGVAGTETQTEETSEDAVEGQEETWAEAPELTPLQYMMEPDIYTWLGARVVDVQGSNRALEYGWPNSSVAGGFKLHYSPLPHRLDTELDWLNLYDYKAEFAYAYRDLVKLNYMGTSLWHNLDHFVPQPSSMLIDNNPGVNYHVEARDNRVFLRLKWPERAYHVFADYRQFDKDGTVQSRFYNGFGRKVAKSREIDWTTRRYTAGINGHFGPVEIEYSHYIKTFDPARETRLLDTIAGTPNTVHSVVPELETNSDTIRVHSSLTGRIVTSATFVNGEKDNNTSHSEVEFRRAYGDMTIIPFNGLTVAVRYRYKELQEDVPAVLGRNAIGLPGITTQPIEQRINIGEVSVRYTPFNELGLKAEYAFENHKRDHAEEWNNRQVVPFQDIPVVQNIHKIKIGADSRPMKTLSVHGSLEYDYTGDPVYPVKPDDLFKGRFHADWIPASTVNVGAHYRFSYGRNQTAHMGARWDNIGTQTVWTPTNSFFMSASYDYFRNKDTRDIRLSEGDSPDTDLPLERLPYRDSAHIYTLSAGYTFLFPLALEAEYHQSWSMGGFRTSTSDSAVSTDGLGELTDLKTRETGGSFSARYSFPKNWGASVTYTINDFQDLKDKPQDGPQDGTAHTVLVMLSKKW